MMGHGTHEAIMAGGGGEPTEGACQGCLPNHKGHLEVGCIQGQHRPWEASHAGSEGLDNLTGLPNLHPEVPEHTEAYHTDSAGSRRARGHWVGGGGVAKREAQGLLVLWKGGVGTMCYRRTWNALLADVSR
jgi:hypothetical protein